MLQYQKALYLDKTMRSVAMKEIVVVALTGCPKYFLSFRNNSGMTQGTTHLT